MGQRGRRRHGDGGAALIEMALVLPMLLLLLFGILELGGAFKDFLTTSDAVRQGTRLLSASGSAEEADCRALEAAINSISVAADVGRIERIEIFEADSDGNQIASETNTYTHDSGDPHDCANWTVSPDPPNYPPSERQVLVGSDPLDLVGMRIVFLHDWYSGFPPFAGSFEINQSNIARLEPDGFE